MVQVTASFASSSSGLLRGTAFPSSASNPLWSLNASPNVGSGFSGCIAIKVLEEFDIPIANAATLPSSTVCTLPGYDVNNADALSILKLGMAAFLKDGLLFDVFANGDGQAEFVQIYPSPKQVTLSVRMCIPTKEFFDEAKVVIVRGYDPPPIRQIKPGEKVIPSTKTAGELTPLQVANTDCALLSKYYTFGTVAGDTTCQGNAYQSSAVVSYKDPVLTSFYMGQADQLYNPKAFEEVSGYIIDFDTHHNNENVTYQTSPTTPVTYSVPFSGLPLTGQQCAVLQNSSAYATFGWEKHIVDPVEITDRYGTTWPILLGVQSVEVMGHTVQEVYDYRSVPASYGGGYIRLDVDERIVHSSVPAGKHWHWKFENGQIVVYLYSPKYDGAVDDYIWDVLGSGVAKKLVPFRGTTSWSPATSNFPTGAASSTMSWSGAAWPNLGAGLGTMVYKVAFTVLIDRPSIVVTSPEGDAIQYAQMLEVAYYPIVMYNAPAPVAYCMQGQTGIVDHTLDIFDNDPSTVQPAPSTQQGSGAWLETQKTGHTVDISLPFLETESECVSVASLLYKLYNNFGSTNETYSVVCGPDDEPELGAVAAGFSTDLRINEINYSYQDGSAFNINVTLGPVYVGVGSWNTSVWQKRTETVSREGIIIWSQGDGCTYRVRVRGLGDYYALNTTETGNFIPGEKVSVKIYNNPVEA